MNEPLDPAPRNHLGNGRDAPHAALTLSPVYRWLIVLNPFLSAAGVALGLAATARGH